MVIYWRAKIQIAHMFIVPLHFNGHSLTPFSYSHSREQVGLEGIFLPVISYVFYNLKFLISTGKAFHILGSYLEKTFVWTKTTTKAAGLVSYWLRCYLFYAFSCHHNHAILSHNPLFLLKMALLHCLIGKCFYLLQLLMERIFESVIRNIKFGN